MTELLKLDWDRVDLRRLNKRLRRLRWFLAVSEELLDITWYPPEVQRSPHGIHIEVELRRGSLAAAEIVALQAALGSDPVRELLNLHRIRKGWKAWNVMFTDRELKI